eukprot:CAMPEP_0202894706 /NCGR_PEP_ID=MMETSP1392-20130828/4048_1 /ASSEMBLY_ACC=CAM_ASM_000868 /TAXON_ID=225041 /ORGANISM="Chlamydomonas chlamydogama, Strain SAG 11-48b" /LENGTH=376 /DNA_ID=CAMNT_0049579475 /DNA_START=590 /DNA_END=1720 /DNA_ORIENTATION=-
MPPPEQPLVPLCQTLLPSSLAQAFGIPRLDGSGNTFAPSAPAGTTITSTPPVTAQTAFLPSQQAMSQPLQLPHPLFNSHVPGLLPGYFPGAQQQQQHMGLPTHAVSSGQSIGATPNPGLLPASIAGAPPQYATLNQGNILPQQWFQPRPRPVQAGSIGIDYSALSLSGGMPAPSQSGPYMCYMGTGAPSSAAGDQYDDDPHGDGGAARAVKRPRLVWTPELHKRFEEAVSKLGPIKSIPKNIMQEMNVEGLTRENVASHLQKYRLQKKALPATSSTDGGDSEGRSLAEPSPQHQQHSQHQHQKRYTDADEHQHAHEHPQGQQGHNGVHHEEVEAAGQHGKHVHPHRQQLIADTPAQGSPMLLRGDGHTYEASKSSG